METARAESKTASWRETAERTFKERGARVEFDLSDVSLSGEVSKIFSWFLVKKIELSTLTLRRNGFNEEDICQLADCIAESRHLRNLSLTSSDVSPMAAQLIAQAMCDNPVFSSLDLLFNSVGDIGAKHLAGALRQSQTLRLLNLEHNGIGRTGAMVIAHALRENSSLQVLTLNHNSIGDTGTEHIAAALKVNTTLQTLNLWNVGVKYSGAFHLGGALGGQLHRDPEKAARSSFGEEPSSPNSLSRFVKRTIIASKTRTLFCMTPSEVGSPRARDDSESIIDEESGGAPTSKRTSQRSTRAMTHAPTVNTTLLALNLGRNEIGDRGVENIASAISENKAMQLQTLNLMSIGVGDVGIEKLSAALRTNSTIQSLNLGRNKIGDVGADHISMALKNNRTLRSVELCENRIGAEGARRLTSAMRDCLQLTKLSLFFNSIGGLPLNSGSSTLPIGSKLRLPVLTQAGRKLSANNA